MPDPNPLPIADPPPATRDAALAAALAALDDLAALGETVEDEWTYVTALAEAGRARLRAAAGRDADAPLPADAGGAVAAAFAEVGRIGDPHRAIDWLSTFPAVVELAVGGTPAAGPPPAAPGETTAPGGTSAPGPGAAGA